MPTSDYVITSTPGEAGESASYSMWIKGNVKGNQKLTTSVVADTVAGITIVHTPITVVRK
jgi:hypothetical protein